MNDHYRCYLQIDHISLMICVIFYYLLFFSYGLIDVHIITMCSFPLLFDICHDHSQNHHCSLTMLSLLLHPGRRPWRRGMVVVLPSRASSIGRIYCGNKLQLPIGSMYGIYGNIYHQHTPNVSIYTIHGSYGY